MSKKTITVGTWTVDAAILRGSTLEAAYKRFPTKNKRRVEAAWKEANPEGERPTPAKAPEGDRVKTPPADKGETDSKK